MRFLPSDATPIGKMGRVTVRFNGVELRDMPPRLYMTQAEADMAAEIEARDEEIADLVEEVNGLREEARAARVLTFRLVELLGIALGR